MKTPSIDTPPAETVETLQQENEDLRRRLQEAEETIEAIRGGGVDALVVEEPTGHRIYTLEGAERPYRLFVEEMQQGAATLHGDGTIAWCNPRLAELLKTPLDKLLGAPLVLFVAPGSHATYENLLWQGQTRSGRGEAQLQRADGALLPVFLTFNALPKDCGAAIGVLVTDLTSQRHHEQLSASHLALLRAEQELREFLENASVPIHWVGPDGIILWANQAELTCLGYAAQEYIGRHIAEFHVDAENIEGILRCLTAGQTLHEHPARLRCKDGSIREVMIDSNVRWEDGKFIHTRCFTRDITARKQAEESLRQAEAKTRQLAAELESLYQTSPIGMLQLDRELRYVRINEALAVMNGLPAADHIGRTVREIVPDIADKAEPLFRRVMETGEAVVDIELIAETPAEPGVQRTWLESWHPLRNAEGHTVGLNIVAQDITARKQAEEALRLAQGKLADRAGQLEKLVAERTAELRTTNEQLEAFVYSIAHDLRAPLRSMEGNTALLITEAGSALSEAGRDFAHRVNRSAQFMDDLLSGLLDFSRMSQQRIELVPVSLANVVQGVLARLENEIRTKNVKVETSCPLPEVRAHEATLGQVLFNLASNALKFVRPEATPWLRLRSEDRGEHVRVWVEDNGIGIAPDHQEQIFRLFLRLQGDKFPGTGIGLAIVQKGVERMGGRVGLESAAGQGSRFWFELRKA